MLTLIKRILQLLPGLLLIAAAVWLAGPYVVIAGSHPLDSESEQLLAIALIVGAWLAWVVFERWRAMRASRALANAVVSQAHAEVAPPADVVRLRESFEQAVSTLSARRKGASLYDLPWYVFIGAPGSGKTTALLNSGLHFALEQSGAQARLRGVGGTRHCDWWFTDEAVFLDTAGRFTTQDSDASADRAAWREFLSLLSKHRQRRPINGVILTISVKDLLTQGESAREQQVEAARYRLRELGGELKIELPVYVMVTMCDMVAGFTEYFDDLTQEGRTQVWGVTFPYEQSVGGQATQAFGAEFEALVVRLNERLFPRLEAERDVARRARIFAFPQQMASLREPLAQFVHEVFASTSFEHRVVLRGVYLTSGTQDGTPIDRLLGAIGRGFRLAPEAVAAPAGRGKAYFVESLLKQVLIGESGLAGLNRRLEMRQAAAQFGVYAALIVMTVFAVMALLVSYRANAAYLADIDREVTLFDETPAATSATSARSLLPRLDAIRHVVDAADRRNADVPWSMRWGLYQGGSMAGAARERYLAELGDSLLPSVARRLEQQVRQSASQPDKLYDYLKAYMMLAEPKRLNKEHLLEVAKSGWSTASGVSESDSASLTQHFQTLLTETEELQFVPINGDLVAQACATVKQVSVERIIYGGLKDTYARAGREGVRLDVGSGLTAAQVMRRRSGVSLSAPVPAIYSRPAFEQITGGDIKTLVETFAQDNWMCKGPRDLGDEARLKAGLTKLYQQDYIATWEAVLNDVDIITPATIDGMAELLGVLGGPTSPLRGLLVTVRDNTRFVQAAPAADEGVLAKGKDILNRATEIVSKRAKVTPVAFPGEVITAHFENFHKLTDGEPGKTPLDIVLGRLRDVEQQLNGLGRQVGGRSVSEAVQDPQVSQLFGTLNREAETLPSPIRELVSELGSGVEDRLGRSAAEELVAAYQQDVVRVCERVISGRYPFGPNSRNEVSVGEFTRLFGPAGVYDTFFTTRLQSKVEARGDQWTWRSGIADPPRGMLGQFAAARAIRDAFFTPGAAQPQLRFFLSIDYVDAETTGFAVEVDGQRFDKRGGARTAGTWPGPNGGTASATFQDRTGIASGPSRAGDWALFRLIEIGEPSQDGESRKTLTFRGRKNHLARVVFESEGANDPFSSRAWREFTCAS